MRAPAGPLAAANEARRDERHRPVPNVRPRDRRDRDARSQTAVVAIVLLLAPPAQRHCSTGLAHARGPPRPPSRHRGSWALAGWSRPVACRRASGGARLRGWVVVGQCGTFVTSQKCDSPKKIMRSAKKIHGAAGARALATPRRVRSAPVVAAAAAAVRGRVGGQVVCGGRAGKGW